MGTRPARKILHVVSHTGHIVSWTHAGPWSENFALADVGLCLLCPPPFYNVHLVSNFCEWSCRCPFLLPLPSILFQPYNSQNVGCFCLHACMWWSIRRCGGKEVWWSRGSVPASGQPGPGSNFGLGSPHLACDTWRFFLYSSMRF